MKEMLLLYLTVVRRTLFLTENFTTVFILLCSSLIDNRLFSSHPTPETTDPGSRRELKSIPFISYLSGLLTAQQLSDERLVSGVEIRCEEKGHCPAACHLCRRPGRDRASPTPVLLEVSRIVPLYTLVQDNITKEHKIGHVLLQ
ncbi:astrotactin-2-like [Arapaima gigas]